MAPADDLARNMLQGMVLERSPPNRSDFGRTGLCCHGSVKPNTRRIESKVLSMRGTIMAQVVSKLLFDQEDHELLAIVNDVLDREQSRQYLKNLLFPYLHPNGIKEMAAPKELRIAYAVIHLLDTLEIGGPAERLRALRSVRDEVLHCAQSALRMNTGRVLLQIMKELVRAHGDYQRQLELAHDFRRSVSGKPRIIRAQLKRYHLLEMPEEWNQLTLDDHVHDANTKGRKSPTHLIMDAWIKGIRSLNVIHYNHVRSQAAAELLEAAEIMGLNVRIGVEFAAPFRGRYVRFIWEPRGFGGTHDFLRFLEQPDVVAVMTRGREVSDYQQKTVLALLDAFNRDHLRSVNEHYRLSLEPLSRSEFLSFVGPGQASRLHLAAYTHKKIIEAMRARLNDLRTEIQNSPPETAPKLVDLLREMDELDSHAVLERYLSREAVDELPLDGDDDGLPALLTLNPCELVRLLTGLHAGSRIVLNLSGLDAQDVLELLYECEGKITHLELFNLKDHVRGKSGAIAEVNELQVAVNHGNIIRLKRMIRGFLANDGAPTALDKERTRKIQEILLHIGKLKDYYRNTPLKSRIGTDSTGRSFIMAGMGLAVFETLPARAQRQAARQALERPQYVPVRVRSFLRTTHHVAESVSPRINALYALVRKIPGLKFLGYRAVRSWEVDPAGTTLTDPGNIITLGGTRQVHTNGLCLTPEPPSKPTGLSWPYLNSGLKNGLKVLIGFIPAFLTFWLTKDWWLLAYFGAVIWFGITGVRNIIQSVLGGGGIRRSPLLRWKDYISWDRLADSLLFTGFSVPLLDFVVKTVILDHGLNITTETNPTELYTLMALANGIYISSHNALRGLPNGAIFGNFFRSLLSIPLAIAFNALAGGILGHYGVVGVNDILQKWAAIISKAASDCVAGIIEGLADRYNNLSMRLWDYAGKLSQVFDVFARVELLFPETDVSEMLRKPKRFIQAVESKDSELGKIVIINALDLLYFWMYQPRARTTLISLIRTMSAEELQVLERSQAVLGRNKEVSQMFVDGLVGKRFSKALSFYLDRWEEYLKAFREVMADNGRIMSVVLSGPSPTSSKNVPLPCGPAAGFDPVVDVAMKKSVPSETGETEAFDDGGGNRPYPELSEIDD